MIPTDCLRCIVCTALWLYFSALILQGLLLFGAHASTYTLVGNFHYTVSSGAVVWEPTDTAYNFQVSGSQLIFYLYDITGPIATTGYDCSPDLPAAGSPLRLKVVKDYAYSAFDQTSSNAIGDSADINHCTLSTKKWDMYLIKQFQATRLYMCYFYFTTLTPAYQEAVNVACYYEPVYTLAYTPLPVFTKGASASFLPSPATKRGKTAYIEAYYIVKNPASTDTCYDKCFASNPAEPCQTDSSCSSNGGTGCNALNLGATCRFCSLSGSTYPTCSFAFPSGFSLDSSTGAISGSSSTLGSKDIYIMAVNNVASTTYKTSVTSTVTLTVNDNPPGTLSYPATSAYYYVGVAMTTLSPTVSSGGGAIISYILTGNSLTTIGLSFSTSTGQVSGSPTATCTSCSVQIVASNTGGSSNSVTLTFTVLQIAITYGASSFTLQKGTIMTSLTAAVTPSASAATTFTVSPALPSGLVLSASDGSISGTPSLVNTAATYTITAKNAGGGSASTTLSLTVNDSPPATLAYGSTTSYTYYVGVAISSISPSSTGGAVISYSLASGTSLPQGLTLSPTAGSLGVISGTPTALYASTSVTITATNSGGSTSVTLTISVVSVAISYSPKTLVLTSGVALSSQACSVTPSGGVSSFSVSPSLPAGLSLNAVGSLSGTTTAISPTTSYTIQATNAGGGSASTTLSITVNDVAPAGLAYTGSPFTYYAGVAISGVTPIVSAAGGTVVSYSVSPTLPSGLAIDTVTGQLSGTPSAVLTTTSYSVTASNSGGSSSTTIQITVLQIAISYTTTTLTLTKGTAMSNLVATSIPTGSAASFSVTPSLPDGLALNSLTGTVSGTSTAVIAPVTYAVSARNELGGFASFNIQLSVIDVPPSSLAYSSSTLSYYIGVTIASLSPATRGGAIVSYIAGSQLPPGLVLDMSSGVISGTPSSAFATSSITITASNTGGSAIASLTFTVTPITIAYPAVSGTQVLVKGVPLIDLVLTTFPLGSATYFDVSPILPSGLSLNAASGTISGTPDTVAYQATYTVTGTNDFGAYDTVTIAFQVNDVKPSGLSYPFGSYNLFSGIPIADSAVPVASGGGAITSFSVVQGTLPAGLIFNNLNGKFSGTPTATSPSTTLRIEGANSGGTATVDIQISVSAVSLVYSVSTLVATRGTAIDNLPATVTPTGSLTVFAVSPSLPDGLLFSSVSGTISGIPSRLSDQVSTYTVTGISATNSISVTFLMTIVVNDVAPSLLTYSTSAFHLYVGVPLVGGTAACGGGAVVSYTVDTGLLPAGIILDKASGILIGSPTSTQAISSSVIVRASNSGGSSTMSLAFTVDQISISYETPTVAATLGSAFGPMSPTIVPAVIGATAFSITPQLPLGLTIDSSSGVIAGRPSAVTATLSYTILGTNAGGGVSTYTLVLAVNDVPPGTLVYPSVSFTFFVGVSIGRVESSTTGGAVTNYDVTGSTFLPAGLTLNSASGTISGSPAEVVIRTIQVTASNSGGSASVSLTMNILNLALTYPSKTIILTKTLPMQDLVATVTPMAGATSFTVSPALPPGLALNATSGLISGVPAAVLATVSYVITASNTGGGSASFDIGLRVNDIAPDSFYYSATSSTLFVGVPINAIVPIGIGATHVTYSLNTGVGYETLPAGLLLDVATGIISGIPTSTSMSVTVTVSAGNTGGVKTATTTITVVQSVLSYPTTSVVVTANSTTATVLIPTLMPDASLTAFTVMPELPQGLTINPTRGVISGYASILSSRTSYVVTGSNFGGGSSSFTVSFEVVDVAPSKLQYYSALAVVANNVIWYAGIPIGELAAVSEGGAVISYSLSPGSSILPPGITLNSSTGHISGTPSVNASSVLSFQIMASNSGGSTSTILPVTVSLIDISYATRDVVVLKNSMPLGPLAIRSNPSSLTGGVYTITGTLPTGLMFDSSTGTISGKPLMQTQKVSLIVTCTTPGGGVATTTVSITVNDQPPSGLSYPQAVAYLGVPILLAPLPLDQPVVSFRVTTGVFPSGLLLNATSGFISGVPYALLSDAQGAGVVVIEAINTGGSKTATVTFTVLNIKIWYSLESLILTRAILDATPLSLATVPANGISNFTISPPLPDGLFLDAVNGSISGTPLVLHSFTVHTVTGTSVGGGSASTLLQIAVNDQQPYQLTYGASTSFTLYVGVASSFSLLPRIIGDNVAYSVATGTLPSGMFLDLASGAISGIPSSVFSMASITIRATNSGGSTAVVLQFQVLQITLSYMQSILILSRTVPFVPLYPVITPASSMPYTRFTVSPGLPSGLTVNMTTGVLGGIPTAVTSSSVFIISASNSGGGTTIFPMSITVNDLQPILLTYTSANFDFYIGVPVSGLKPPTNGGGRVILYTVSSGALPAGLRIDGSTGVFSGIPSALPAPTTVEITASNSGGSTKQSILITVHQIAVVPSASDVFITKGDVFPALTFSVTPTNGASLFAITPSLPIGLALNTTSGLLHGSPQVILQKSFFTITATNGGGGQSSCIVSITVNDVAPVGLQYPITSVPLYMGVPMNVSVPVMIPKSSGGSVTAYAVNAGSALPTGLIIDSKTGKISGTPIAIFSVSIIVRIDAKNSGGSIFVDLSFTVSQIALSYPSSPQIFTFGSKLGSGQVMIPALTPATLSGLTFAVTPSLASGLTLSPTTGVVSGTATMLLPPSAYSITATNGAVIATSTINLSVIDIPPTNFRYSSTSITCYTGIVVSPLLASTSSRGEGGGPVTNYSIVSGALPAGLVLSALNGTIAGQVASVAGVYSVDIAASNSGGSASTTMTFLVTQIAAVYSATAYVMTIGVAVSWGEAIETPAGGVDLFSISPALPPGLAMTGRGMISGIPTSLLPPTAYTLTGANVGGGRSSFQFTITVNDIAPISLTYFTGTSTASLWYVGVPIVPQFPLVTGGRATRYAISNGALPAGISINALTGVLQGIPASLQAASNIEVSAFNSGGSAAALVRISVAQISISYPSSTLDFTRSFTLVEPVQVVGGGVPVGGATKFSVSPNLPPGLTFNTTTGAISGTPTSLETGMTFSITGSNKYGGLSTATVGIIIRDVPPSLLSYSASGGYEVFNGVAVSGMSPTAQGGPVIAYIISKGVLPIGLVFDSLTGVISGTVSATASAVTSAIEVTATNSGGSTTTILAFSTTPPSIKYPQAILTLTANTAFAMALVTAPVNLGSTARDFMLSPSLPSGLSFNNATGSIAGTPRLTAAWTAFAVTGHINSVPVTCSFSMIVLTDVMSPSQLTYPTKPVTLYVGVPIVPITPSSMGGQASSYSIVSGQLPAGLLVDQASGKIYGTPLYVGGMWSSTDTSATTTFTVQASNEAGTATSVMSLTVSQIGLAYDSLGELLVLNATVKVSTLHAIVTPAGAAMRFTVSPNLPSGLSLNSVTGEISGVPLAGSALAAYTIVAMNNGGGQASMILRMKVLDAVLPPTTIAPGVPTSVPSISTNSVIDENGTVSPTNIVLRVLIYVISLAVPLVFLVNIAVYFRARQVMKQQSREDERRRQLFPYDNEGIALQALKIEGLSSRGLPGTAGPTVILAFTQNNPIAVRREVLKMSSP